MWVKYLRNSPLYRREHNCSTGKIPGNRRNRRDARSSLRGTYHTLGWVCREGAPLPCSSSEPEYNKSEDIDRTFVHVEYGFTHFKNPHETAMNLFHTPPATTFTPIPPFTPTTACAPASPPCKEHPSMARFGSNPSAKNP